VRLDKINEIQAICHSLSNKNRLKIIYLLKDSSSRTLREIYELSRDKIGIEHRETLYKYLESLVDVGILTKQENEDGIKYKIQNNEIILDLSNISI